MEMLCESSSDPIITGKYKFIPVHLDPTGAVSGVLGPFLGTEYVPASAQCEKMDCISTLY